MAPSSSSADAAVMAQLRRCFARTARHGDSSWRTSRNIPEAVLDEDRVGNVGEYLGAVEAADYTMCAAPWQRIMGEQAAAWRCDAGRRGGHAPWPQTHCQAGTSALRRVDHRTATSDTPAKRSSASPASGHGVIECIGLLPRCRQRIRAGVDRRRSVPAKAGGTDAWRDLRPVSWVAPGAVDCSPRLPPVHDVAGLRRISRLPLGNRQACAIPRSVPACSSRSRPGTTAIHRPPRLLDYEPSPERSIAAGLGAGRPPPSPIDLLKRRRRCRAVLNAAESLDVAAKSLLADTVFEDSTTAVRMSEISPMT